MELKKGDLTYLSQFDCFVKIDSLITLSDNKQGYRVSNTSEGITEMLIRKSESYGVIRF